MLIYLLAVGLFSCGKQISSSASKEVVSANIPFNADSAYQYIADQVAFGARVPGSEAHKLCMDYLISTLERFGWQVNTETGTLPNYDLAPQPITNILAHHDDLTSSRKRVLLCAHWDCRPWCDNEAGKEQEPVLGANDGASGVGILLEIARQINIKTPSTLVDIVFFDCEDMGTPEFYTTPLNQNSWCLGSQLWAQNIHQNAGNGRYEYGILLDMAGASYATFPKEYFSLQYARGYVENIWHIATKLGYSNYFVNTTSGPITDDHYYVNSIAGIPCIDIICYDPKSETGFPAFWHTTHDDMSHIDRQTLKAVGQTLMGAITNATL